MLSQSILDSIRYYTQGGYVSINGDLRGDASLDPLIDLHIHRLDQALSAVRLPRAITVYRGVDADYAQALRSIGLRAGMVLDDRAFLSTTRSKVVALSFMHYAPGGILMRVRLPKGTKALDIAPWSADPREQEILLARNSGLCVINYDREQNLLELECVRHG